MLARTGAFAVAAALACCLGCWGPYYKPESVSLPPLEGHPEKIESVLVSDFYRGMHSAYQLTTSHIEKSGGAVYEVTRTRNWEDAELVDISAEVAAAIAKAGLPARHKVRARREDLQPGEILLSGVIDQPRGAFWGNAGALSDAGDVVHSVFVVMTLFIYGTFTPLFYPIGVGRELDCRIEASDRFGNALLDAPAKAHGYHEHLSVWSIAFAEGVHRESRDGFIASLLAPAITRAIGEAKPTGEARAPPVREDAAAAAELLISAARRGSPAGVASAVVRGADIDGTADENGRTALMIAASRGDAQLVEFLLSEDFAAAARKVDRARRGPDGKTALDLASEAGHSRVVEALRR